MPRLTRKEEEIMQALWSLEKAFVKEVLEALPDPKPHYNTVSTIIRKLEEKGYVGHEAFGNTHRYFPKLKREAYREQLLDGAVEHYFDNSFKEVVAHFAQQEKISPDELKEILRMIEEGD